MTYLYNFNRQITQLVNSCTNITSETNALKINITSETSSIYAAIKVLEQTTETCNYICSTKLLEDPMKREVFMSICPDRREYLNLINETNGLESYYKGIQAIFVDLLHDLECAHGLHGSSRTTKTEENGFNQEAQDGEGAEEMIHSREQITDALMDEMN
ncbi:hypothetical protein M5K25_002422 [Dendrobium thyrsiflorum]|uniref:Uncharacterized protein n=1 Tax=Dendrobium thyrsiflorum TaxID=117978 RepID=A0ABD0VUL1_DENTH